MAGGPGSAAYWLHKGSHAALAGAALTGKDAQTAVDAGANAVDNNLCGTGLCIAAGFAIVKGVALGVAWVGTELAQKTAKAVTGEENVISDTKLSEAQKAVGEEALLQAGGMFIGEGLVSIGGRILTKTKALRKFVPKKGVSATNDLKPGRAANKLRPDRNAAGDHSTFARDDQGNIFKYETYEKTRTGHYNPLKRYDGGNPNGTPGKTHTNSITRERISTPHVQGKNIPGGVRKPLPNEIPKKQLEK